jgi:2-methylisocitrate lyase-like PEP mutase family enzyme
LRSTEDRYEGLEIAIDRANQYIEAGADLTFITYVATLDEVQKIKKEVEGPVSIAAGQPYNINGFTITDLKVCGVERVSLPTLLIFTSLYGMNLALEYLRKDNLLDMFKEDLIYPADSLNKLL